MTKTQFIQNYIVKIPLHNMEWWIVLRRRPIAHFIRPAKCVVSRIRLPRLRLVYEIVLCCSALFFLSEIFHYSNNYGLLQRKHFTAWPSYLTDARDNMIMFFTMRLGYKVIYNWDLTNSQLRVYYTVAIHVRFAIRSYISYILFHMTKHASTY